MRAGSIAGVPTPRLGALALPTPVPWLPPASPAPPAFSGIRNIPQATASSHPQKSHLLRNFRNQWSVGMFVSVLEHQWEGWKNRPHPQTKSGGVWAWGIRDGGTGSKTDLGPLGLKTPTCGSGSREEGKGAKVRKVTLKHE